MSRASGFYWIRLSPKSRWIPGEWFQDRHAWYTLGLQDLLDPDEVFQVGPRIKPPEKP